jgi:predicted Zn-dependent protease with MMP-like domain
MVEATDLAAFERMVAEAVDALPEPFRRIAASVIVRVEDWPARDVLDDLGIDDPLELTGLYDGIPLTEKSVTDPAPYPDTVFIYREPILEEWHDRGNVSLTALVRHVVVHEFAHHFGWSDAMIAKIDPWWE